MWLKNLTFSVGVSMLTLTGVFSQMYTENNTPPLIIRSGLKAAIGYSTLYLSDAVRPFYTTSEYYTFSPDLCGKIGAMITVQPRFFGERFELVFDPAFTKFSYGNAVEEVNGDYKNKVDVDVDAIELPMSLRYNFLRGMHILKPYLRGGYSYSFFVDTEAEFVSKDKSDGELIKYETSSFDYSKFQDAVFLCAGVELDLRMIDFTLELVLEKGDGIHKDKFGDNFLKVSGTNSIYLQGGVLF